MDNRRPPPARATEASAKTIIDGSLLIARWFYVKIPRKTTRKFKLRHYDKSTQGKSEAAKSCEVRCYENRVQRAVVQITQLSALASRHSLNAPSDGPNFESGGVC